MGLGGPTLVAEKRRGSHHQSCPDFPWLFRCGPGFKGEDIRPRVVSRNIQRHHRLIDFIEVEIGDD